MRPQFYSAPAQPQVARQYDMTAPVMGMDGTMPLHQMPEGSAVYLYNIVPSEYGCRTREGTRLWAQNLAGPEVKTILPFVGDVANLSLARLFAATSQGIYNITAQGQDGPAPVVTFTTTTGDAGFCSFITFTDPNSVQTLLVADGENGLYEYTPVGDSWTKITTEVTFPDATTPADIAYITSHKERVWLIPKNSANGYYLPIGAKYGAATKFQFGAKMRRGGYLVALYNWSLDGGEGVDDYLLAVSKGGDLLAYRGADPAQASEWDLVGNWFIGPPPEGRRVAVEVGGDTLILSVFGLNSAAGLLQGVDPTRVERNVTGKVTRLIRDDMKNRRNDLYWQTETLPEEGLCIINRPVKLGEKPIQYVLNLNRTSEDSGGGWGLWRDVPGITFDTFNGQVFFGTAEGQVFQMENSLDNVDFSNQGGIPVKFSLLTGFSHLGAPAIYKQVQFIRAQFLANNRVRATSRAVYDYEIQEITNPGGIIVGPSPYEWDTAIWDAALWSGLSSNSVLSGGSGYGRSVAFAVQGEATSRLTLINIESTWVPWAFL